MSLRDSPQTVVVKCPKGATGGLPHQSADWFAMTGGKNYPPFPFRKGRVIFYSFKIFAIFSPFGSSIQSSFRRTFRKMMAAT